MINIKLIYIYFMNTNILIKLYNFNLLNFVFH